MKICFNVLVLILFTNVSLAQEQFNIWTGPAPGSEKWDWHEQTDLTYMKGDTLVYNVTEPSLSFYPPDPALANGTAVIICPGGSFSYLHINTEGSDVARWLNRYGVAAFVLKYRVIHSETSDPMKERNERMKDTAKVAALFTPIVMLGIADAKQSITYLRAHADKFGIKRDRIGILGFSAGGTLAVASAFNFTIANKPDFDAPIYAFVPPSFSLVVSSDAPPVFIAAATDDELHLVPMSISLYNSWLTAGRSAELHIYSRGGHGFGMNKYNLPSDTWIDRYVDWLRIQGLLKK
jgi:acetyl esterase/lipase